MRREARVIFRRVHRPERRPTPAPLENLTGDRSPRSNSQSEARAPHKILGTIVLPICTQLAGELALEAASEDALSSGTIDCGTDGDFVDGVEVVERDRRRRGQGGSEGGKGGRRVRCLREASRAPSPFFSPNEETFYSQIRLTEGCLNGNRLSLALRLSACDGGAGQPRGLPKESEGGGGGKWRRRRRTATATARASTGGDVRLSRTASLCACASACARIFACLCLCLCLSSASASASASPLPRSFVLVSQLHLEGLCGGGARESGGSMLGRVWSSRDRSPGKD